MEANVLDLILSVDLLIPLDLNLVNLVLLLLEIGLIMKSNN
jgi:hypothetical protein